MKIKKHSGIYTLEVEQFIKTDIKNAWDFFSNPENLSKITPEYMGFKITSAKSVKMYQGQIITYKIGILPFLKSNWVTEITHVKEGLYFVDEQRSGPYKIWHHEHFFNEKEGGVLMMDKVSFALPFGFLGKIAFAVFIKKELKKIFNFRFIKLEELFNKKTD
jgi:ligand-binding SRPBCC domain-containing protein